MNGIGYVTHLAAVLGLVVAAYGVWGHVAFGAQAEEIENAIKTAA
jgi:hypothetical protein